MNMKRIPSWLVLILAGLMYLGAAAPSLALQALGPAPEQARTTKLVTHFIEKYHYKRTELDDTLSAAILKRYLESLDPNRSYFLAADIERFQKYSKELDDALSGARLDPAFDIFNVFRQRLTERANYAVGLLKQRFDFRVDEDYRFDRSKLPWAKNRRELDDIWRRRVKNDMLSLRLAGDDQDKIVTTLRKRYQRLATEAERFKPSDVYERFINAYTMSVEPHTAYFSPRASDNFNINMSLSLEGIGAELQAEEEYTLVRRIIHGGPADKSNRLHAGDRITGVGQGATGEVTDVVGWRLDDVVALIRGPKGSLVRLKVLPKGSGAEGKEEVFSLIRNKINLEEQAAKKSVLEVPAAAGAKRRIGVIDVPTFYMDFAAYSRGEKNYRSTTRDVRRLIDELIAEGVAGVVIDLRGNGGGSLVEAIDLTGLFIESGPVVQVKDSSGQIEVSTDSDPSIAYAGPLAVLVDRNSASASEIFAGAIQDYRRGIIVGEPTYGKGTVQTLVNLDRFGLQPDSNLGQLKLTTAQFFRISGSSTQHRGVVPDIIFPTGLDADTQGERGLDNALAWTSVQPATYSPRASMGEAIPQLRALHEHRIKGDEVFGLLLSEIQKAQADQKKSLSLVESVRRKERDAAEKETREHDNRFRKAFGLAPLKEDEDKDEIKQAEEATEAQDERSRVLLKETAQILGDAIGITGRTSPRTLHAGGDQGIGMVTR